jgi:hypothetical protein
MPEAPEKPVMERPEAPTFLGLEDITLEEFNLDNLFDE